jgi:hypothetical protein
MRHTQRKKQCARKSKAVPLHAVKAQGEAEVQLHSFLTLQLHDGKVAGFITEPLYPTEESASSTH